MRRTATCLFLSVTMLLSLSGWAEDKKAAKTEETNLIQLLNDEQWAKYIEGATKFVEAGTADFGLYSNLGLAYLKLKDYPNAIASYKTASELDTNSADPFRGIAAAYLEQGDKASALDSLSNAAALDPAQVDTYAFAAYDLGMDFIDKKDYAQGEPFMRKAFEAKGDYFDAALGLAQCLQNQKKYAEAIPAFEKVVELNPKEKMRVAYLLKLLECKYFGKQYAEAILSAEKILEIRQNDERALMYRAGSYLELKDCSKAVPAIESYLAVSQNTGVRLSMIKGAGHCLYDQNKFAEAGKFFDQALSVKADDEDALLYGGNSLLKFKDNNPKALPYFKKLAATTKDASLKASAQRTVNALSKGQ